MSSWNAVISLISFGKQSKFSCILWKADDARHDHDDRTSDGILDNRSLVQMKPRYETTCGGRQLQSTVLLSYCPDCPGDFPRDVIQSDQCFDHVIVVLMRDLVFTIFYLSEQQPPRRLGFSQALDDVSHL